MEGYQSKGVRRDMIDSMLTYVNKDLLLCKLFYFFFFGAFGSLYPLLAIYFKQLGMNPTQSGLLIGFRPFIEFCSAPFWGGVADKLKKWKQLMLFSLFCWIVFTLAMAFVKPPAHACFGNLNTTDTDIDIDDLVRPAYSTVYYKRSAVHNAFFALLLIIVIGEFFSAPAITFADTVTLSYLGEDTDNYGRQRMFGSLGWGLAMFFVGMALDHSTTFPEHPCENQHNAEKNYIICFAVFSVLMSCAFITATQFRFPGQMDAGDTTLPTVVLAMKDKVKETITGKKKIDRERLVEDGDSEPERQNGNTDGIPPFGGGGQMKQATQTSKENGKPLQISLASKQDMVSDVINSPGASQALGPQPEDPFMGRWMTVIKLLAQLKYVSVLFVAWFMGFGIGLIFTFLFWHLQDLGGSPTLFGVASVINHISELLAYFLCSRFILIFGHIKVLYAGLLGNVARFLYISWLKNPWWVLPFECVQGLTHAAVWATTCSYITQAIPVGLRSSAQGILQGLHHGLGRGCGAVFGGILVYSFGSEVTFRAYGVTCIFVLAAFIGSNYFLKRQGILVDPVAPHEMLEEEPHLDPHGVPSSSLARELSNSMLKAQDVPVSGYGSTLGTGTSARDTLSEAFQTTASGLPEKRKFEEPSSQPPRNTFSGHPLAPSEQRDVTESPATAGQVKRDNVEERRDSQDGQTERGDSQRNRHRRKRDSLEGQKEGRRGSREGYDQSHDIIRPRDSGYDQSHESYRGRDTSEGYDQPRKRDSAREDRDQSFERDRSARDQYEPSREGHSRGHRRSYDDQAEGYGGQRSAEDRRHRQHHKKRRSFDQKFGDADPNPKEQVVFERLPDLATRKHQQQQQPPRPDGGDLYRPY